MIDLVIQKHNEFCKQNYKLPTYLYISDNLWDKLFCEIMEKIPPRHVYDIYPNKTNGQFMFRGMEIVLVRRYNWCEVA